MASLSGSQRRGRNLGGHVLTTCSLAKFSTHKQKNYIDINKNKVIRLKAVCKIKFICFDIVVNQMMASTLGLHIHYYTEAHLG